MSPRQAIQYSSPSVRHRQPLGTTQVQVRTTPQIMIYNHIQQAVIKNGYSERVATLCACQAIDTYQQQKQSRYQRGWVKTLIQTHIDHAHIIDRNQQVEPKRII